MSKKKLGRGLQVLLGGSESESPAVAEMDPVDPMIATADLHQASVDELDRNPFQPRQDFESEELAALAQSVRAHGVIQPIVVRLAGDRYQIVAGERRLRAAQEAGLTRVPIRVVEIDDQQTFEFALVENLQREDLNAIEKGQAFQTFIDEFDATHEELAVRLGIDRSTVSNFIRLLELPQSIQEALRAGQISNGHARALLSLTEDADRVAACRRIITESLSVRQTEELVRADRAKPAEKTPSTKAPVEKSNHLLSLENDLRQKLGAKVDIHPKTNDTGTITIHFGSNDDFERVIEQLTGPQRH